MSFLEYLGSVGGGFLAAALLIVGLLGLSKRWGSSIRGLLSAIPIGSPSIWAIVLIVLGFVAGGGSYLYAGATGLFSTATITNLDQNTAPGQTSASLINCRIASISQVTLNQVGNYTFRADPYDVTHYYVDLTNGSVIPSSSSINGTIVCDRLGNIDSAAAFPVEWKFQTYTNKQSSTDTGTYRMVLLASGNSMLSGFPSGFKATAYLNDGSLATTSSNAEKTSWVFTGGSSAQSSDTLGFYLTLPSSTNIAYLNAQDSVENKIVSNGQVIGRLTITQLTR